VTMAKLMGEYSAIPEWEQASCVRAAILAPRLPAGTETSGVQASTNRSRRTCT